MQLLKLKLAQFDLSMCSISAGSQYVGQGHTKDSAAKGT